MHHDLKTLPAFFEAVKSGDKNFEIRDNTDRGFQKGDTVTLRYHDPKCNAFGGEDFIDVKITYVTNYEQIGNFVVFGFVRI